MTILRALNRCPAKASGHRKHPRYRCEVWSGCADGRRLELCLHPGGHSIPAEWVAEGYDWMLSLAE